MPVPADLHLREYAAGELRRIGDWWLTHSLDNERGGFLGEIDYHGTPVATANKGAVLNSRLLWFFSAAAGFDPRKEYRDAADRAFDYLIEHFDDRDHGGVYWELDCNGAVVDDKKQIYALCFYVYALAAYYQLTTNRIALQKAQQYFNLIETRGKDVVYGGYVEAFTRDWHTIDDVRLSDKDLNAPKTMNTHLHLLEAYTTLHLAAPSRDTSNALRYAIDVFCEHIVDVDSGHLKLFFDSRWNSASPVISYGHDIEASWLLWEAAEVLGDASVLLKLRPIVEHLAETCLREGFDGEGQVGNEFDPQNHHRSTDSIWWVQAEALVGFLNAHQLTGNNRYFEACEKGWQFIRNHHVDTMGGDWHWLAGECNKENRHYKAGFWKGPYHNGRAMMEICKRIDTPGRGSI